MTQTIDPVGVTAERGLPSRQALHSKSPTMQTKQFYTIRTKKEKKTIRLQESFLCCCCCILSSDTFFTSFFKTRGKTFPIAPPSSC